MRTNKIILLISLGFLVVSRVYASGSFNLKEKQVSLKANANLLKKLANKYWFMV